MTATSCLRPIPRAALLSAAFGLSIGCARSPAPFSASRPRAEPEATSLFGEPLFSPALTAQRQAELESRLAEAREQLEKSPGDPDAWIWVGRRTAYLGRYREAIQIFGSGSARYPGDPRFLRHRAHRYITTRRFDQAITDLKEAVKWIAGRPDEIEPDGIPNARNTPTSTTNSNIWYHLGLANYLMGDFENAARSYEECLKFSKNPDMLVATSHWLFMALRRLNRAEQARQTLGPIRDGMDIIENYDYYRLLRMYQGQLSPEELLEQAATSESSLQFATVGYGVGNWYLTHGRRDEAAQVFRRVLASGQWPSFGFIASEADLRRLGGS